MDYKGWNDSEYGDKNQKFWIYDKSYLITCNVI